MILRSKLALPTLLAAATAALGACAGGPLDPPAPAIRQAAYVCDGGERFTARFEYGSQRVLFLGEAGLDGRVLNAPKNTLVLIPDQGDPVRLVQGPAMTSNGFYYRTSGVEIFGEGDTATLITTSGRTFCRVG